jgi:Ser/Thr protein kinase RdoA (MazF antagonist)
MAVKTPLTHNDFENILSQYTLGTFIQSEPIQQGTVQTNFFIQTTQGKFVLRYYETRSQESVLFESDLLAYLAERRYPCPAQFKNAQGAYVSMYRSKPLAIFEFVAGQPIEQPSLYH